MNPAPLIVLSYLLGAIPTSLLVGKWARGIDLREHGSGNLGATNAFRVLGWRLALPVFIVDVVKGFVPTYFFPLGDDVGPAWALAYGAAAIVGHVFSIYVRFRGGKGVATSAGVFLAVAPVAALIAVAVWIGVVYTTRIVSLASLLAAFALPIAVYALHGADEVFWVSVVLAAFVTYSHRPNIRRLLRGEEHRFDRRGAGEAR